MKNANFLEKMRSGKAYPIGKMCVRHQKSRSEIRNREKEEREKEGRKEEGREKHVFKNNLVFQKKMLK